MRAEIKQVGPAKAKEWLAKNTRNRPLTKSNVEYLAREMLLGRWRTNGDAIRFSGDDLIDGQHRLHAVIKSGVTITTLVVTGVDAQVFDTIDTGRRRSGSDVLSIMGEKNTTTLASALGWVQRYSSGELMGRSGKATFSNVDIENILTKHPGIRRSVSFVSGRTRGLCSPGMMSACHYLFGLAAGPEDADEFVEEFVTGAGLSEGDPVLRLRDRMIQNKISKAKVSPRYAMALVIKAWNARRAGRKVKSLKFTEEGSAETFPVVS